jgi:Flp pilus assembly protein TadG
MKKQTNRRSRSRGAELVEVSLILAPLLGITFLLFNVSIAIFLRSTLQHAVREGVRYAITGQNSPGPCQDDSIKTFVQNNSAGFLSSTAGYNSIHVHFIDPVNGTVTTNAGGNIVEVSVEAYQFNPWSPYLSMSSPVNIWARAYDVMEPVPAPLACITKSE